MNLWLKTDWKNLIDTSLPSYRSGIRLKFDKGVDAEVKRAIKEMIIWLKSLYFFPVRIPIYIKNTYRVQTKDHDQVCGKFFGPYDMRQEPYICIATGDYKELLKEWGKDDALASILATVLHELTHYFQWINGVQTTERGLEWQATFYKNRILSEYSNTRDNP